MRFLKALAALLLMATHGAAAEQAVTAGQLMASGFEIRASYMVEKGTPVLVLQKGAEAYLCSPLQGDALLKFEFAPVGKDVKPLAALPTVCAQLK
ncbi:MAG: hypothetical protein P4L80_05655 [Xanthobacteraceae bacterium]|nr:hypothetical protein [Xanthobacteraceae bacterium]